MVDKFDVVDSKIMNVSNLKKQHTVDSKVADLLGLMIKGNMNFIYSGDTGAGKSSNMIAFLNESLETGDNRTHVVDYTAHEMALANKSIQLHTRDTIKDTNNLLKEIYKTDPSRVIINELDSRDVEMAIKGMLTGHVVNATFFGNSVDDTVERLVSSYHESSKDSGKDKSAYMVANALDFIIHQEITNDGNRVITEIKEVLYNEDSDTVELGAVMAYNKEAEDFVFVNPLTSKATDKMIRNGILREELDSFI